MRQCYELLNYEILVLSLLWLFGDGLHGNINLHLSVLVLLDLHGHLAVDTEGAAEGSTAVTNERSVNKVGFPGPGPLEQGRPDWAHAPQEAEEDG